jgi:hypothetical protein
MNRIFQLAIAACFWAVSLSAHAATVTMDPDSLTVHEGGTISVDLLADTAAAPIISLTSTDPNPFAGFFNANPSADPQTIFTPEFVNTVVNVVPIPASLWLFGSALFLLGAIIRKRTALT